MQRVRQISDYRLQTADHRLFKAGCSRSAVCGLRSTVFFLSVLVQSLFLRGQALAGEAGSGFPASSASFSDSLGDWLKHLVWLLGAVLLVVKLIKEAKPNPPNHKQFAPIDHSHADALSKGDKEVLRKETTRELLTIRQEMGNQTGKLESSLDTIRNAITTQNQQILARLDDFNKHNEDRIGHVYETIQPFAPAISAASAKLDNHLEDHRAGKV